MNVTVETLRLRRRHADAFTLAEVVVALGIAMIMFGGIILGFLNTSQRAEWAANNLAAEALCIQGIEQARAATWDPQAPTPVDNCAQSNFPAITTNQLDIPIKGTNIIYATNTWTITLLSTNPYPLKMIRVDTTWQWYTRITTLVFTNTIATLRAPNQ